MKSFKANTVFLIVCASGGFRYLLQWYLTRNLSVDDFGFYSTTLVWSEFLAIFLGLGFDLAAVRFIPKYRSEGRQDLLSGFIKFSFLASLGLGLASWALGGIVYVWPITTYGPQLRKVLFWGICLIPPTFFVKLCTEQLKSFERPKSAFIPSLFLRPFLNLLVLVFLSSLGFSLTFSLVCVSVLISLTLITLIQSCFLFKEVPDDKPTFDYSDWLGTGVTLLLGASLTFFQGQFDVMLLGFFRPGAETGLYSAASKVALLCSFPLFAINGVYTPKIIGALARNNPKAGQALLSEGSRWATLITGALFLTLVLFGKTILGFFGENYVVKYPELILLSLTQLFGAIYGLSIHLLNASGHHSQALRILLVSSLVTLLCASLFIPLVGTLGAACSNLFCNLLFIKMAVQACKSKLGLRSNPGRVDHQD